MFNTEKKPNFELFKHKKKTSIETVNVIKISSESTLFEAVKKIRKTHYTIFFCPDINLKYIDEDMIIDFVLKNDLSTKIKDLQFSKLSLVNK